MLLQGFSNVNSTTVSSYLTVDLNIEHASSYISNPSYGSFTNAPHSDHISLEHEFVIETLSVSSSSSNYMSRMDMGDTCLFVGGLEWSLEANTPRNTSINSPVIKNSIPSFSSFGNLKDDDSLHRPHVDSKDTDSSLANDLKYCTLNSTNSILDSLITSQSGACTSTEMWADCKPSNEIKRGIISREPSFTMESLTIDMHKALTDDDMFNSYSYYDTLHSPNINNLSMTSTPSYSTKMVTIRKLPSLFVRNHSRPHMGSTSTSSTPKSVISNNINSSNSNNLCVCSTAVDRTLSESCLAVSGGSEWTEDKGLSSSFTCLSAEEEVLGSTSVSVAEEVLGSTCLSVAEEIEEPKVGRLARWCSWLGSCWPCASRQQSPKYLRASKAAVLADTHQKRFDHDNYVRHSSVELPVTDVPVTTNISTATPVKAFWGSLNLPNNTTNTTNNTTNTTNNINNTYVVPSNHPLFSYLKNSSTSNEL